MDIDPGQIRHAIVVGGIVATTFAALITVVVFVLSRAALERHAERSFVNVASALGLLLLYFVAFTIEFVVIGWLLRETPRPGDGVVAKRLRGPGRFI